VDNSYLRIHYQNIVFDKSSLFQGSIKQFNKDKEKSYHKYHDKQAQQSTKYTRLLHLSDSYFK